MSQMKTLEIEIVASSGGTLPPSGMVHLSLLDVSMSDAPAVSVAALQLRCAGLMPIRLSLTYDLEQVVARREYALSARIEQAGQLVYVNMSRHTLDPISAAGLQRLTVDPIQTSGRLS